MQSFLKTEEGEENRIEWRDPPRPGFTHVLWLCLLSLPFTAKRTIACMTDTCTHYVKTWRLIDDSLQAPPMEIYQTASFPVELIPHTALQGPDGIMQAFFFLFFVFFFFRLMLSLGSA